MDEPRLPCELDLTRAGVPVRGDVRPTGRASPWRGRIRWTDPKTRKRHHRSRSFTTEAAAWQWVDLQTRAVEAGLDSVAMRVLYEAALAGHTHGLVLDVTPGPCRVCTALEALHRLIVDGERHAVRAH